MKTINQMEIYIVNIYRKTQRKNDSIIKKKPRKKPNSKFWLSA